MRLFHKGLFHTGEADGRSIQFGCFEQKLLALFYLKMADNELYFYKTLK